MPSMKRAGGFAGTVILVAVAALVSAGCGGGISVPKPCGQLTDADCRIAVTEAQRAMPVAVTRRGLVSATADVAGPLEADPCGEAKACGDLDLVVVVWLTYPGPGGDESWPVELFRRQPGGAIEVVKPFPGSILDPRPVD